MILWVSGQGAYAVTGLVLPARTRRMRVSRKVLAARRRQKRQSQHPVAADCEGGPAAESQQGPSVCARVSEIHSRVGAGEVLHETFTEVSSGALKKCKVKSIKVPLVGARAGEPGKLMLYLG